MEQLQIWSNVPVLAQKTLAQSCVYGCIAGEELLQNCNSYKEKRETLETSGFPFKRLH
jgi:hypothetical protein